MTARFDPATLLEAGGFRRSVAGADFDLVAAAAERAFASGRGLLLAGPTGCGKTLALRCLFPPSVPPNRARKWVDCFDPVQVGWLDDRDIWTWANLIVLDDLGAEAIVSDYGVQRFPIGDFFLRLSRRMDAGDFVPRICVTTNFSAAQISDRYGERMLSRLLALVVSVRMVGEDRRGMNPQVSRDGDNETK